MPRHLSLTSVGTIAIPAAVRFHRFFHEARAYSLFLERKDGHERVVGTANTLRPELYAWAANVERHIDCTGFVYLLALDEGTGMVYAHERAGPAGGDIHEARLTQGAVLRLNDFCLHWTEEAVGRVCMFVGAFAEPDDERALNALMAGVQALAAGSYYDAPRVSEGYRILQADECLAANDDFDGHDTVLLADAQAQGRLIETCGVCGAPAVRADPKFPFFTDASRCRTHLGEDLPTTGA